MDDCCNEEYNNGLVDSSSFIICRHKRGQRDHGKGTIEMFSSHPLDENTQVKKFEELNTHVSNPLSVLIKSAASKNQAIDAKIANPIRNSLEPFCQVKLDSINQLKDSTRKLLSLLDDIQSNTYSNDLPCSKTNEVIYIASIPGTTLPSNPGVAELAPKKIEAQTKSLNTIYIEADDDDCSIFKRLTRKCHCLNQQQYNDFIIHFNEDTKYFTSTIGEIIKNMRILKKFLYMGGNYAKNALTFLNEGLVDSTFAEKEEILQGCTYSDMCNVFEDHSIVIICISWPCKLTYYGDNVTQNLAASFLYKLAQIEEGRRYLKFTSRITNDIKKVLRTRKSQLNMDTTEFLNATLNLMRPQNSNAMYHCRQIDEGYGVENIKALSKSRKFMTLEEILTHLDLLRYMSNDDKASTDLTAHLPSLLLLFKQMLKEYDNSEMNIIITDILKNLVSNDKFKKQEENVCPKTMVVADTATETVEMINEIIQITPSLPHKNNYTKKENKKSKRCLGPNKFRQASRRKEFENAAYTLNRSRKFNNDRRQVIVVPIETKNKTA